MSSFIYTFFFKFNSSFWIFHYLIVEQYILQETNDQTLSTQHQSRIKLFMRCDRWDVHPFPQGQSAWQRSCRRPWRAPSFWSSWSKLAWVAPTVSGAWMMTTQLAPTTTSPEGVSRSARFRCPSPRSSSASEGRRLSRRYRTTWRTRESSTSAF